MSSTGLILEVSLRDVRKLLAPLLLTGQLQHTNIASQVANHAAGKTEQLP